MIDSWGWSGPWATNFLNSRVCYVITGSRRVRHWDIALFSAVLHYQDVGSGLYRMIEKGHYSIPLHPCDRVIGHIFSYNPINISIPAKYHRELTVMAHTTLRVMASIYHFMVFASAVIVTGIISYLFSQYSFRGSHIVYQEVIVRVEKFVVLEVVRYITNTLGRSYDTDVHDCNAFTNLQKL